VGKKQMQKTKETNRNHSKNNQSLSLKRV